MLSGWKPEEPLLDPMCGGGTLLVEAAAMARGRAPGASRRFGFEKLKAFQNSVWERVKKDSLKPGNPPKNLQIFGSDHDPRVLGDARRNVCRRGSGPLGEARPDRHSGSPGGRPRPAS